MFASTGEKLADFDIFHPDRMASRILGMGDMLTLIEQAEQHFEADQAEEMAAKLAGNEFTLDDFLQQMMMIRKMGPIGGLLGMLPGAGQMKDALSSIDDRDIDRTAAIIQSMTPQERHNPNILNASRRKRIANGSGTTVSQVNSLVERFGEARKMMSAMAGRFGFPGARKARRRAGERARKASRPGAVRRHRRSRAGCRRGWPGCRAWLGCRAWPGCPGRLPAGGLNCPVPRRPLPTCRTWAWTSTCPN